ncbi:MAG TPA: hypothetical protein VIG42_10235, partial [Solirubrobacteraceae bacterium]
MSPESASRALERSAAGLRALHGRSGGSGSGSRALLGGRAGTALGSGLLGVYLSVLVLLPIAALLDS